MNDLPFGKPDHWRIAFVDVETTGVMPGYHEMVDIGIVMADVSGNEIGRFFRRIMPEHPERAQERALQVNGFSVERWESEGAVSPEKAVEGIIEFYGSTAKGKNVILCAYNVSFDNAFLDHLFRSVGKDLRKLHRYALDLPSVAWGMGLHDLYQKKIVGRLGVKDEPRARKGDAPWKHTGITGAELDLRIYRALLDQG